MTPLELAIAPADAPAAAVPSKSDPTPAAPSSHVPDPTTALPIMSVEEVTTHPTRSLEVHLSEPPLKPYLSGEGAFLDIRATASEAYKRSLEKARCLGPQHVRGLT